MRYEPGACNPNRLRHLLDDRLDDDAQANLAEHLDGCVHCRKTLDTLAAGSLWWQDARRFLGDDGAETVPRPDAKKTEFDATVLDFLAPSNNPEHLGRLGPYEVIGVLGRGGMGLVLRGIDAALNRHVAIKILAPELATSATARRRFAREGQAAAAISHDHIVAIHSVDASAGLPYLVMQLVSGRSLQERIDQTGPLTVEEILRIGMQVASGLSAAHAVGLIHRDIKPSNILLENCVERVKITDFGLARAVDDASLTQSGVVAGTPQYMSPEQARGEPADHRADLFSLGSVLYAMCTGRAPFRADSTPAVLRRVSEETPRPIREINPEIPAWLERVVVKLHAKDPAARYQSATEVAELLSRCLAHVHEPTLVPLPEEIAEKEAPMKSRKRLAIAAVIGLFVVCGLGAAEAAGVTKFVSTVVKFATAQGTIRVTVNDPSIKVRIDGQDLIITGAGPEEIRVNAGVHKVVGSKDGKSVEKLVSISRGGVETVEVSLEPAEKPGQVNRWVNAPEGEDITLARAELERARERLEWAQNMFVKQYVSREAIDADLQKFQRAKMQLGEARRNARTSVDAHEQLRTSSHPLGTPEALAKRAAYLKESLDKIKISGATLKAALGKPDLDRGGILVPLQQSITQLTLLDREFFELALQFREAGKIDEAFLNKLGPAVFPIAEVSQQFTPIHKEFQLVFKAAGEYAVLHPEGDQLDAIILALKNAKGGDLPETESMAPSIQRLRMLAKKSSSSLDGVLGELQDVEGELAKVAAKPSTTPRPQPNKPETASHPLGTPEALAKRATYLKETLEKIKLFGKRLKDAVDSKETDSALYRGGVSTHLCMLIETFVVLEHEFMEIRPRIMQATSGDVDELVEFANTLATIKGLDAEFDLMHRGFQMLFDQAAEKVESKPGTPQIDAFIQVIKTPKAAKLPSMRSMAPSIARTRKFGGNSDAKLDNALAMFFVVESEHGESLPAREPSKPHKGVQGRDMVQDLHNYIVTLEAAKGRVANTAEVAVKKDVCMKCHQALPQLQDAHGVLRLCPALVDTPDDLKVVEQEVRAAEAKFEKLNKLARNANDPALNKARTQLADLKGYYKKLIDAKKSVDLGFPLNPPAQNQTIDKLQAEIVKLKKELETLQEDEKVKNEPNPFRQPKPQAKPPGATDPAKPKTNDTPKPLADPSKVDQGAIK